MHSIKPGRGPSFAGGVTSLIFAALCLGMTILFATVIPQDAPAPIRIIFPLFPLGMTCMAIFGAVYNFKNATSKNRYSTFDITTAGEEPDPLNTYFNNTKPQPTTPDTSASPEARLQKLETLQQQGLITPAEYTAQRERILNSL